MPNDITREARELCERATPGPWEVFKSVDTVNNTADYFVQQIHRHPAYRIDVKAYGKQASADDAEFIARSRTLIPELLDLIVAKDTEIARLTLERNAAVSALRDGEECLGCKYSVDGQPCYCAECNGGDLPCEGCLWIDDPCSDCERQATGTDNNWEWRGATDN